MKPQTKQKIAFTCLGLAAVVVIIPVIVIFVILIDKGISAINWQFLSTMPRMGMRAGGIYPAIMGTVYLVSGTILVALPLGVLAAIYLVEYAKRNWWTRMIEIAIVNLAGVPSVVYGLFGMGFFVIFFKFGASILAGSLTLAIMILPVIITASKEALMSVPHSFREASLALGVSKWQTIRCVVLPNALPGILTGTILGISRAAGETAPILFTVAAFYLPRLPKSIFDQCMALPYHLYVLSTQVPNVKESLQYGTALVLVGMIFLLNLVAIIIRSHMRSKKQW
ncbi:MAG: Phosphate transport system permease protein PstA [Candidatus Omnitrophica bacterium ADurb.Bin292]|jgi:phosphate transport system permease protein|nr:MAG: Phosphate transport system permease protein PstA [Candidatus Omnitrophica bacterium ADurb.Bin292]HOG23593.1 phosphate ABC transporter permease PstA [Candidatus Omnitrophota bacterium]HPW77063.1 phosphate ABC transporter permease PstA [Candidatus Omnitrophota bacterium]HQB12235.1 phosphate ABC transporter permease PstA [Candidatus Omnitrophota bacterium]